ncbi:short chain dehydrogenase [compost metagenome]
MVEPGFFRTDFLDASSLVRVGTEIAEYAETVGAMRGHMASANHQQPGDPARLAVALLALADSGNPPVRLPLGSDTVARIAEKNRKVESELAAWHAVAVSTDLVDANA